MQKLIYTMLMATQKLLYYFTDHEVMVITSYPRAIGRFVQNRLGGSLAGVCACILVESVIFIFSAARVAEAVLVFRDQTRQSSWILASVRAVGSGESESWILASAQPAQPR